MLSTKVAPKTPAQGGETIVLLKRLTGQQRPNRRKWNDKRGGGFWWICYLELRSEPFTSETGGGGAAEGDVCRQ